MDSLPESELVLPTSTAASANTESAIPLSPVAVKVEKTDDDDVDDVIIVDDDGTSPWKKSRIISTLNTAIEALQTVVEIVKDLKE